MMMQLCVWSLLLCSLVSVDGYILTTPPPPQSPHPSATDCTDEFYEAQPDVVLNIGAAYSRRIENVKNLRLCKKFCLQYDTCRSITFHDSSTVKVCYLNRVNIKDDGTQVRQYVPWSNMTLVERKCSEWSLRFSSCTQKFDTKQLNTALEIGGNDSEQKRDIGTVKECMELCSSTLVCRSITYQKSNQECYLNKVNHRDDGAKKLTSRGMTLVERVCSEPQCGRPFHSPVHESSRIHGGEEAHPHSYPWMVAIQIGADYTHCGGSILSNKWILTAAHCLVDTSDIPDRIKAGVHNKWENEASQRVHFIKERYVHEDYNSTTENNDIALLELEEKLEYSYEILPICLPREPVPWRRECVATGWGKTREKGHSVVLNQVLVPIIPYTTCSSDDYYGLYSTKVINKTMICAGYEHGIQDSCKGDSGGPLACLEDPASNSHRYQQHGVTSWGDGCGKRMKPGVYTRVTHYIEWIQQKTNGAFQSP